MTNTPHLSTILLLFMMQDLGANVSVNDIVIKSAAYALRDVPEANATWNGKTGRFRVYDYFHSMMK